ncbi:hypothetical protein BX616_008578 [Lobosporangium transversale]|uniref:Cell cycle control protein n=1 Tax=Lobosporangium transversale TaxID=64571 RepID=A0A1Y2GZB2_9FUNG|nr:cell cycle control protein [Lobosporangium transversale]KAF9918478.1 hypothetical protein BX616_008578 [Lobosporangium transversale]ORZ27615.1 cell cycle control protein [Lobosporangium transversale]|eukprot:XP_021885318.1 cell cycle control protein [Lobosporangium transversale]
MDEVPKRRPPNTSFKQQRLKAWQPILTAKTVLPTYFIIGILFAPLGGLLVWRNNQVSELSFEYTACKDAMTKTVVPESTFVHSSAVGQFDKPTYMILRDQNQSVSSPIDNSAEPYVYTVQRCSVQVTIPVDLQPPVMLYYKLTNFYQNHRKYTKSLDHKQLSGEASSLEEIRSRKGCPPSDELIYPCGFIANSMFNDTISDLFQVASEGHGVIYAFEHTGIALAADKGKYGKTKYTDFTTVRPPPYWAGRWPGGEYSTIFPPPDLSTDEHFQVWMRTSGWPTFLKPYGRNDKDILRAGDYQMSIDMNFPIETYGGKKYIVISTIGAIGGRNNFLGIIFIVTAILCAGLGVIFTAFHIIKPRIIGDHSKISFGAEATVHTRSANRADDVGGNRIRSRYEDD